MKTKAGKLDLQESGTLCHMMLHAFDSAGGIRNQPLWLLALYEKLAALNDKLMRAI